MAVISAVRIGQGKRTGSLNDRYRRAYEEPWLVYTDDARTDPATVIVQSQAFGVPAVWSSYATDTYALCHNLSAREDSHPQRWIVTAEFSSDVTDITRQNANPLLRPPEVTYDTEEYEEAMQYALALNGVAAPANPDGQVADPTPVALQNSAQDWYDPPPTRTKSRSVLTIVQNLASFDERVQQTYVNTTNKTRWRNYVPGLVYCRKIGGKREFENNLPFWSVTFIMVVGNDDWTDLGISTFWELRMLDAGRFYRDSNNRPLRFTDGQGHVLESGLLRGDGQALALGAAPVFRNYQIFPEREFGNLPINLNF